MVDHSAHTFLAGTVCAAKIRLMCLNPVSDHLAFAVGANWRKLVYRAFETIEYMPVITRRNNFKRQIVIIAAYFAARHLCHLPYR
jgi:hypothetical protein